MRELVDQLTAWSRTPTTEGLEAALAWTQRVTRFRHAAVYRLAGTEVPRVVGALPFRLDPDWLVLYTRRDWVRVDPVARLGWRCEGIFSWAEAYRRARHEGVSAEYVDYARAYSMRNGLIGVFHSGASGSEHIATLCVLAGVPRRRRADAAFILEALLPLAGATPLPSPDVEAAPPALTRRECEVLEWAAAGKGVWEISRILGIAERTVKFHLHNAYRKLDSTNRSQAIAKALSLNLL